MKLLLDIGNSRIKWCSLQAGKLAQMHAAVYDPAKLADWCRTHLADWPRPESVSVASVAGPEVASELSAWCRSRWELTPWFARTETEADGVRNGYTDTSQLGVDRWLALIAARRITTRPLCVFGCGTAITLDALDSTGGHLGGVIIPGPELMRMALNMATRGARTSGPLDGKPALGRDTEAGVANGIVYAMAGMVERLVADLSRQLGDDIQCLMTGGGAGELAPLCRVPLRVVDDLVLRGLAYYADSAEER